MNFNEVETENSGSYYQNDNDYLDTKIGRFNKDSSVITIYTSGLSYDMTEEDILVLFEQFGYVNYVKLIKDSETHASKGIAFIQMPHANHARVAIKKLDGAQIEGRTLKVSVAKEQDNASSKAKLVKKRRKPYKAYVAKANR